jgi:hypothetical protein
MIPARRSVVCRRDRLRPTFETPLECFEGKRTKKTHDDYNVAHGSQLLFVLTYPAWVKPPYGSTFCGFDLIYFSPSLSLLVSDSFFASTLHI